jgi:type I restriction enzyme M protein
MTSAPTCRNFGKRTPLTREHFSDFEKAFGKDPLGEAAALKKRKDTGESGRFRKFTREWIAERDDSLDISWLKDDSAESSADLPEPAVLASSAMEEMEAIMEDLRGILAELGSDDRRCQRDAPDERRNPNDER